MGQFTKDTAREMASRANKARIENCLKHRARGAGLGATVVRIRRQLGISMAETARRGGIAKMRLSELERSSDPNPSWKTIQGIAKGLGIKATELIARNEEGK